MTFEERKREIFFDGFHEISHGELTHWLEKEPVLQWVGTKITRYWADRIFSEFTDGIKYVEENDEKKYRISDSGKIYYEFLKKESTKYELDREAVQSTITISDWTRKNMIVSGILAAITTCVVMKGCFDSTNRYLQENNKWSRDSIQQLKTLQSVQELNQELHKISLSLQDTAKVKVKIEK